MVIVFIASLFSQSKNRDYDEELRYQNQAINGLKKEINDLRMKIKKAESRENSAKNRISSIDQELALINKLIQSLKREEEKTRNTIISLKDNLIENEEELSNNNNTFPEKPHVIMVVGVNGVGKTTTIGKLANKYKKLGLKVVIGAADTFRAAAIDQLVTWANRVDVPIIKQEMGSDPASVAFDTLNYAKANDADLVLIDTAGRLHNKINLMNELSKIKRVMNKVIENAPHDVMLVLDGSTGQNAFIQAKEFTNTTEVSSLTITKLDGTAKGGVVIGISDEFKIPVKYIGVGEALEDLQDFNKLEFVDSFFD